MEYTYDSWGKLLSTSGSLATTLGSDQPFRYRGYVYDTETSLYYLQTRYYDPNTCRFISSDVVLSTGQGVLGHNVYAYCNNNCANMVDNTGNLPSWATKLLVAVAIVAVVATVAAITISTAGVGTAAAVIAVEATKGAAIGLVTGASMGAGTAAIKHRVTTGSWEGAGEAALEGAGDGAITGAITGTFSGIANGVTKVAKAARAWDPGSFDSRYKSINYHYEKHVIKEGFSNGNNVVKYTNDAIKFSQNNSATMKYTFNFKYGNASWNSSYSFGAGGMFTSSGKIITFWYR